MFNLHEAETIEKDVFQVEEEEVEQNVPKWEGIKHLYNNQTTVLTFFISPQKKGSTTSKREKRRSD